mgnify:CR=1 FL=1
MRLKVFLSILMFLFFVQAHASVEVSWGEIDTCNYRKNNNDAFLGDVNHISKELSEKHRSASKYTNLEKTLAALFAPHPGAISLDIFKKTAACSAKMRVSLLQLRTSQTTIKHEPLDWVGCYEESFLQDHPILVAVKKLDSCMKK